MTTNRWRTFLLLCALESLAALALYLATPSEAGSAWLLGYSKARLLLALPLVGLFLLLAAGVIFSFRRPAGFSRRVERLAGWLEVGNRLLGTLLGLAAGTVFLAGAVLFTYLFIPVPLRVPLGLGALLLLETLLFLGWAQVTRLRAPAFWQPLDIFPRLAHLDAGQRRVFWILVILGLAYFCAFIPANSQGAETPAQFFTTGGDEYVTYPIPVRMLTPGSSFEQSLYFSFVYEDYHYGYPFYALSALVLLPIRLIFGAGFGEQTRLNLLLLRQLVSLLPLIGAAGILTYLGTRFKHLWRSLALFVLLLSVPGFFKYNLRFWHPDGLLVLCLCLTLFFLARDQLRLGSNFYLAALFCGLASAIKLYGFFFFLAVAGVLVAAWWQRSAAGWAALRRVLLAGLLFVVVMSAAIALSSPYLFVDTARARFVQILTDKSGEMSQGYADADPGNIYRTGLEAWLPFYDYFYAAAFFLAFLGISLAAAGLWGPPRERLTAALILAWALPVNAYLIAFVAVKAYQYTLPGALPLFAGVFGLAELPWKSKKIQRTVWLLVAACLAIQFWINLRTDWGIWMGGM